MSKPGAATGGPKGKGNRQRRGGGGRVAGPPRLAVRQKAALDGMCKGGGACRNPRHRMATGGLTSTVAPRSDSEAGKRFRRASRLQQSTSEAFSIARAAQTGGQRGRDEFLRRRVGGPACEVQRAAGPVRRPKAVPRVRTRRVGNAPLRTRAARQVPCAGSARRCRAAARSPRGRRRSRTGLGG